jgi:uncharacterized protein
VRRAELIDRLRRVLATAPSEVVAVYLYGSRARDEARSDSDVDLAFFRTTASPLTLRAQPYALASVIERALGLEVDLVELNRAPPDLVHEVLRDGEVVLDRDPAQRVRMEVRARGEYLDMLPVLRRYRRARTGS